jgi:UDP-N-acetylmuramoylalanine--D-glutamate ligase
VNLAGREVLVVGLGRSGQAAARALVRRGAVVTGNDARAALPPEVASALEAAGVRLVLGGHEPARFATAELIVLSPGVPPIPALDAADRAGVPVVSEVELAFRLLRAPVAAITGTNGKSTTTELLGAMVRAAGLRAFVGGNLGEPLIEAAEREATEGALDVAVCELSSFQLERIVRFRPRAAAILNITEDHLDRYRSMAEYIAAKARIFANMGPGDDLVLSADDPRVSALALGVPAGVRVTWASASGRSDPAGRETEAGVEPGSEVVVGREGRGALRVLGHRYPLARITLAGRHNLENMLAAVTMARRLGLAPDAIQRALEGFGSLAHRIEPIGEVAGVRFFDDSKGTNVDAVVRALEAFGTPVVLIAGGKDKGGDYAPLARLVRERVKRLVLIGEAAARMEAALGPLTDTVRAPSLEAAVELAFAAARPGDSVLLSPACSSFDMFRDYLHRSEVFAEAVRRLAGRVEVRS